jgi:hypothetical protein
MKSGETLCSEKKKVVGADALRSEMFSSQPEVLLRQEVLDRSEKHLLCIRQIDSVVSSQRMQTCITTSAKLSNREYYMHRS